MTAEDASRDETRCAMVVVCNGTELLREDGEFAMAANECRALSESVSSTGSVTFHAGSTFGEAEERRQAEEQRQNEERRAADERRAVEAENAAIRAAAFREQSQRATPMAATGTSISHGSEGDHRFTRWHNGDASFVIGIENGDTQCHLSVNGQDLVSRHVPYCAWLAETEDGLDLSDTTCVASARPLRDGTVLVAITLQPNCSEGGLEDYEELEMIHLRNDGGETSIIFHESDMNRWWASLPGPLDAVRLARSSCDWYALNALGAPADERGDCADREARRILESLRLEFTRALDGADETVDGYALSYVSMMLSHALTLSGLSDEAREELETFRGASISLLESQLRTISTRASRAYQRGQFDELWQSIYKIDEISGSDWNISSEGLNYEVMSAHANRHEECLRARTVAEASSAAEALSDAPRAFKSACRSHLATLQRQEAAAEAQRARQRRAQEERDQANAMVFACDWFKPIENGRGFIQQRFSNSGHFIFLSGAFIGTHFSPLTDMFGTWSWIDASRGLARMTYGPKVYNAIIRRHNNNLIIRNLATNQTIRWTGMYCRQ